MLCINHIETYDNHQDTEILDFSIVDAAGLGVAWKLVNYHIYTPKQKKNMMFTKSCDVTIPVENKEYVVDGAVSTIHPMTRMEAYRGICFDIGDILWLILMITCGVVIIPFMVLLWPVKYGRGIMGEHMTILWMTSTACNIVVVLFMFHVY